MLEANFQQNGIIHVSPMIYIDTVTGRISNKRSTSFNKSAQHGLGDTLKHYSARVTPAMTMVMLSNQVNTRYYIFYKGKRYTYLSKHPVKNHESGWVNLFTSLLEDCGQHSVRLYNTLSHLIVHAISNISLGYESFLLFYKPKTIALQWRVFLYNGCILGISFGEEQQSTLLLRHPIGILRKQYKIKIEGLGKW